MRALSTLASGDTEPEAQQKARHIADKSKEDKSDESSPKGDPHI